MRDIPNFKDKADRFDCFLDAFDLTAQEIVGSAQGRPHTRLVQGMTPAAKLQMIYDMMAPTPIYCECKPDCDHVVGFGPPLISKEQALEILELPK